MEGVTDDIIFDGLGSLTLVLKKENDNMQIFICELVPTMISNDLEDRIDNFNVKLKE